MSGRMDKDYFEEKRDLALEALDDAIKQAGIAKQMIAAARYEMPNLTACRQSGILICARHQYSHRFPGSTCACTAEL